MHLLSVTDLVGWDSQLSVVAVKTEDLNELGFKQHDVSFFSSFIHRVHVVSLPSTSDSCLWVAVLEGKVVGVVAAVGQWKSGGAVELQRMCVDRSYRRCGVGVALGRKVLEFAVTRRCSSVVLGTTAYTRAAHQLYRRLGFRCVGVTNGYVTPGARCSLLERIFYRVRHHHYSLDVQNSKTLQMDNTDLGGGSDVSAAGK